MFYAFHIYLYCMSYLTAAMDTNGYVQSALRHKCGHFVMNCECQCKIVNVLDTFKYISCIIFPILIFYSSLMILYSAEQLQHLETSTTKTMKSGLTPTNLPSICPSDRKCRRLFEFRRQQFTSVPMIWVQRFFLELTCSRWPRFEGNLAVGRAHDALW